MLKLMAQARCSTTVVTISLSYVNIKEKTDLINRLKTIAATLSRVRELSSIGLHSIPVR